VLGLLQKVARHRQLRNLLLAQVGLEELFVGSEDGRPGVSSSSWALHGTSSSFFLIIMMVIITIIIVIIWIVLKSV
jgi:hypothetical protein